MQSDAVIVRSGCFGVDHVYVCRHTAVYAYAGIYLNAYPDAIGTEWRKRALESGELASKWWAKRRTFDAFEAHRFAADVYKEMAFNGLKSAVRIANVRELDNGRLELDFCVFDFSVFFLLFPSRPSIRRRYMFDLSIPTYSL